MLLNWHKSWITAGLQVLPRRGQSQELTYQESWNYWWPSSPHKVVSLYMRKGTEEALCRWSIWKREKQAVPWVARGPSLGAAWHFVVSPEPSLLCAHECGRYSWCHVWNCLLWITSEDHSGSFPDPPEGSGELLKMKFVLVLKPLDSPKAPWAEVPFGWLNGMFMSVPTAFTSPANYY